MGLAGPFSAVSLAGLPRPVAIVCSDYQFFVTPDLFPGDAALDVYVQDHEVGYRYNCCELYLGRGVPIGLSNGPAGAPVPRFGTREYVMFVASNVAAVRVGSLGVVLARTAADLPPGDKVVAFRGPQRGTLQQMRHPRRSS